VTATASVRPGPAPGAGPARLSDVARAAAVPLIAGALIIALLSAWVVTGGGGTIIRIRIRVELAAIPMRAYTVSRAAAIRSAPTYLTIRNLGSQPDELLAVRTPASAHVTLLGPPRPGGGRQVLRDITIPAGGSVTLTPFGDDVVLRDPVPYEADMTVPLTLVFRRAGQVQADATVTAPGTP